ncbi:MAG: hypothetical protein ABIS14_12720 [Sphingomonas sp.]
MTRPLYPDAAIDEALRNAAQPYWSEASVNKRKVARARAEMIRLRDSAGPRIGVKPSPGDLQLALNLRAKDLLGLSDPNGFYLPPAARRA